MAVDPSFYSRRAISQSRFGDNNLNFPSFHSSHRMVSAAPANPLSPPLSLIAPPPPYSSTSLNFRSRSLDHRRFPAFSGAAPDRAIYIAGGYGPARSGSGFTGELFPWKRAGAARTQQTTTTTTGTGATTATIAGIAAVGSPTVVNMHYKSSSLERPGVTVVPIRKQQPLPAHQMQSTEWKSSEWSGATTGIGGPALALQQQQQQEGGTGERQQDEHMLFNRSAKFSHQRQAWQQPKAQQSSYSYGARREEISEAPRTGAGYFPAESTPAGYATFQRGQQAASGAEQQQQQHEHTRHQQHQREYREWHSRDRRHRAAAASGGGGEHYGAFGERNVRGAAAGGQQQQQQHYVEQTYGGGDVGGGAEAYRYRQHQTYQGGGGQYANGWTGGREAMQQRHIKRSASAGAGGYYGTAGKSKSSGSAAHWSTHQQQAHYEPKRYRKIRFCCFNLIWPPWVVEPSGPPRSIYSRTKASGPPTPTPIPFEHRPAPFYEPGIATSGGRPIPLEQQHLGPEHGQPYAQGPPPGVPEPYMPPSYGPAREQRIVGESAPAGMDTPDYGRAKASDEPNAARSGQFPPHRPEQQQQQQQMTPGIGVNGPMAGQAKYQPEGGDGRWPKRY